MAGMRLGSACGLWLWVLEVDGEQGGRLQLCDAGIDDHMYAGQFDSSLSALEKKVGMRCAR